MPLLPLSIQHSTTPNTRAPTSQCSLWMTAQALMLSLLTAWSTLCDPLHWLALGLAACSVLLLVPYQLMIAFPPSPPVPPLNSPVRLQQSVLSLDKTDCCDCLEGRGLCRTGWMRGKRKEMMLDFWKPRRTSTTSSIPQNRTPTISKGHVQETACLRLLTNRRRWKRPGWVSNTC